MRDLYNKSVEKLALLFLPLTVLLILMAEPLIITMFTDKFEGTIPIFTIYMTLLPTYVFRIGWVLMASGQTKFLLRLAIAMSSINIILSYYLITTLTGDNRLLGIPFATVTVTWLSMFVIMYQSSSTLESKMFRLYPWRKIFEIMVISVISGLPVFILLEQNLPDVALLTIGSIVYGIIFLYGTFKLKIWGNSEIEIIKSLLKSG